MAGMNSGYSNERELAKAIAAAKAKKKTGMNSGYANERELARAIEKTQAEIAAKFGFNAPTTKVAATPKPKPTKKATPSPKPKATLGPLPKNPTLNDYLIRGLKPPVKGKGKLPSDADVRLRGYNA